MKKKMYLLILFLGILFCISFRESASANTIPIGIAVEFMDHAASAYICQDKGWFEEEGLDIKSYESYITGMSLASALARGDIQVAYICLVPAINVYANAKVPIQIVAGTHKHGYGLVVDIDKVKTIQDLERKDVRIGCVREGGAVDVLFHKTMDECGLDKGKVLNNIQRMNPVKQILAIQMGKLDAAFLPEQWATLAVNFGFKRLLMSQDIWPEMQGSVIVVKKEFIRMHPELVKKIVMLSDRATNWINQNKMEAAEIVTFQLQRTEKNLSPKQLPDAIDKIEMSSDVMLRSMERLDYSSCIDPVIIQETIDYLSQLGYINKKFDAEEILDLRFLKE